MCPLPRTSLIYTGRCSRLEVNDLTEPKDSHPLNLGFVSLTDVVQHRVEEDYPAPDLQRRSSRLD